MFLVKVASAASLCGLLLTSALSNPASATDPRPGVGNNPELLAITICANAGRGNFGELLEVNGEGLQIQTTTTTEPVCVKRVETGENFGPNAPVPNDLDPGNSPLNNQVIQDR